MKQIVLAVKLNEAEATVFQHWCEARGKNTSQMIGYMIETILKTQSEGAIMNDKLREAMWFWDNFQDIEKVGSVIAPSSKVEVVECIYLVNEEGKSGTLAILVEPSFFGEPNYSTDRNEILDELFTATCKSLNRRLRRISARLECNGIIDTLTALCDYYDRAEDEDHEYIKSLFTDNNRHEYGMSQDEILKYKRHNKRSVNDPLQLTFLKDLEQHEQGQELSLTKPSQREGCYNDNDYEQRQELYKDNELQGVEDVEG